MRKDLLLIPLHRPEYAGNEVAYVARALEQGVPGEGEFSLGCRRWLAEECGAKQVHLVQSASVGLELAVLLCGLGPGDEVILPSFTFVACANAIALRGATPVFVDIDAQTLSLDPEAVEAALTASTRAVLAVHYAGVPCDMYAIRALADRHGLFVIEDAAQALLSQSRGQPAGSLGDVGVFSFHRTKNVTCGEGGAVVVNLPRLAERAEVLHQNGTDRGRFNRSEADRYTWLDLGSSYAPSEITAAVLLAQLERAHEMTRRRRFVWDRYHTAFAALEDRGRLRRPVVPQQAVHNGHIYYLLLESEAARNAMIQSLGLKGIAAAFHYVPLHSSPGGLRYGRAHGSLPVTTDTAARLVRLPLWPGLGPAQDQIIAAVEASLN